MLVAKDFRKQAWNSLSGKWSTMAATTVIYSVILGVCSGLAFIVQGPLDLGYYLMTANVIREKDVELEQLFEGFKNCFLNALLLYILNGIFVFLWSLLFIIPGIIKSYSYSMSYYILADNPDMDANDARKQSMKLMHGNKWRLFCLDFSFIGWGLLCVLTFGILSFWVTPYQQTAHAAFYQSLIAEQYSTRPAEEPFNY
ncbi:MAG: DUF975 family protein [Clostridia bacterium]|nr:DUF975 family protein [Clostridia bacterium]